MRLTRFLMLIAAALACSPGNAQAKPELEVTVQPKGPNAEAALRPLGPNAQVMERPAPGPNTALMQADNFSSEPYHPSCSAAGARQTLPIRRGEPGYGRHLDRDDDGVACEPSPQPQLVESDG